MARTCTIFALAVLLVYEYIGGLLGAAQSRSGRVGTGGYPCPAGHVAAWYGAYRIYIVAHARWRGYIEINLACQGRDSGVFRIVLPRKGHSDDAGQNPYREYIGATTPFVATNGVYVVRTLVSVWNPHGPIGTAGDIALGFQAALHACPHGQQRLSLDGLFAHGQVRSHLIIHAPTLHAQLDNLTEYHGL